MTSMADTEAETIAKRLPTGAKKACLRMSEQWQFCGKSTFNANGAHSLHWARVGLGRGALAERELQKEGKWSRPAYRLTPLGLSVRRVLEAREEADQAIRSMGRDR